MDPEFRGDSDHHDGTSDATPGGYDHKRRPGELGFAILMLLGSLYLLKEAYGISGFEALSAPGSVPMATAAVLVISAAVIVLRTLPLPRVSGETLARDILPWVVVIFAVLLVGYGLLLKPLGFLPTSALFLVITIKMLSRRSWAFTLTVSVGALFIIWLVFRIVFSVLMPAGIVPEAEVIQMFRNLFSGGAS
ncbi:tripartite tricarboxylate transporter TctB family protein [Salipiger sp.]|uniref:tripartite tricarboxylate transporter TctB family protein n=1 Tax=Salipiger sp. TaxID=2078585 RepID=UPI003A977DC0